MTAGNKPFFAPELYIESGTSDISFYARAFGATENLCFRNDDGTVHVAELAIEGAIFHVHERTRNGNFFPPADHEGTTVCIGLFVADVDAVMKRAVNAGAKEISAARDYEYGYRQGMIRDPFGHFWQIQKKLM